MRNSDSYIGARYADMTDCIAADDDMIRHNPAMAEYHHHAGRVVTFIWSPDEPSTIV